MSGDEHAALYAYIESYGRTIRDAVRIALRDAYHHGYCDAVRNRDEPARGGNVDTKRDPDGHDHAWHLGYEHGRAYRNFGGDTLDAYFRSYADGYLEGLIHGNESALPNVMQPGLVEQASA
jgi:hypothetical protein